VYFNEDSGAFALHAYRKTMNTNGDLVDQKFFLEHASHGIGLHHLDSESAYFEDHLNCGMYKNDLRINDSFLKIGRLNVQKNTISGAFDLFMTNALCNDTVSITLGYFNASYKEW
jgi:hypothetical protein